MPATRGVFGSSLLDRDTFQGEKYDSKSVGQQARGAPHPFEVRVRDRLERRIVQLLELVHAPRPSHGIMKVEHEVLMHRCKRERRKARSAPESSFEHKAGTAGTFLKTP